MIRLGLVGPLDSLKIIKSVAQEMPATFTLVQYVYKELQDLKDIQEFCIDVDCLLFSGPAPYYWVKERMDLNIPSVYIARNGTCLYRALFNILKDQGDFSFLSFDTIARKDIIEAFEELQIAYQDIQTLEYESIQSFEEVTQFHLENYKKNSKTTVVTSLSGPYQALSSQGIKTYRVHPTNPLIRSYLEKAILFGENESNKESQIALIIIRVNQSIKKDEIQLDYSFQKQLLDLYQLLLIYSDQIQATTLKTGDNEFMLIATRGSLDNIINNDHSLERYLSTNSPLLINIGVGYGKTARIAEIHARMAINISKESQVISCMVNDEGKVIESQQGYNGRTESLNDMAKELEMSVESLSNIKAALRRIGKEEVTSKELSLALNLSERSARRILGHLEAFGHAEIVGNQSIFKKGRPSIIYKVHLR